jgi:hypothetical protein
MVNIEKRERRSEKEIKPWSVVLEIVSERNLPFRKTPCAMKMLELVGVKFSVLQ